MKTLTEIWHFNGEVYPYAARLKFWARDTYVVVIKFGAHFDPKTNEGLPHLHAPIGICLTNDKQNSVFANQPLYQKLSVIPRHENDEWEAVNGLNLERFEKKEVLGLENVMHFGKHLCKEIRDVMNMDLKYLFWLINNNFITLNEEAINYIVENFNDRLDNDAIMLNNYRLNEIIKIQKEISPSENFLIRTVQSKMNDIP